MNKQKFNVGLAVMCGVEAAVIVDIMIGFCKCTARCPEYRENGKLFVEKDYIYKFVEDYMPKHRFNTALNVLSGEGFIEPSKDGAGYAFTDIAKDVFSKKPIRITISWQ
jgi:hypothetical protein